MAYKQVTYELTEPTKVNFYLAEKLNLPFSVISRMIDKGRVLINGERIVAKATPVMGKLEAMYHAPTPSGLKPVFETGDFAVFDKPSGLLVHQNGFEVTESLVDDIKHLYGPLANLVHRLDRETSGLVLASKRKKVEGHLKTLFKERDVEKNYLAFAKGEVKREQLVDASILTGANNNRPPSDPTPRVISTIHKDGLKARTMITPLQYFEDLGGTLVKCYPVTGRTHQIRIHLAHIGHPIFGDPFYGVDVDVAIDYLDKKLDDKARILRTGAKRLMLHAFSLKFQYKANFLIEGNRDLFNEEYLRENVCL